jgi:DNA-binding NtrC family response regulator
MRKESISVLFLQPQQQTDKLNLLFEILEKEGYWVDKAQRIEEVDTFLEQHIYDMFLIDVTDISMGECIKSIQKLRSHKTNIIVISDHANDKWNQKASNLGVSAIFNKPITPVLLQDMLEKCMNGRRYTIPTQKNGNPTTF